MSRLLSPRPTPRICICATFYLHHTVVPEVQSHGFNFADVWEVAVDARAVKTDENPQLVRGPIRICGVEGQDLR